MEGMDMSVKDKPYAENKISRKELFEGAGKLVAGTALVSLAGLGLGSCTKKSAPKYPWPYAKLDPKKCGDLAYENWYKKFCCYAVASAILLPLKEKVGEPYSMLPVEAFKFGHGGTVGWGTLCGSLLGASIAVSFIAGEEGEDIINDIIGWYTETEFPIYKPAVPKVDLKNISVSNSPLCHASVGKWMSKEGVEFFSPGRSERCARLSADVAIHTATLLNLWADNKYEAEYDDQPMKHGLPSQNDCEDCHT